MDPQQGTRSTITDTTLDAVIVGGGIAGLAVAAGLSRAGRRVVVLESRSRLGGRLVSASCTGGTIDLGATWIWSHEKRVNALAQWLGIELFDAYETGLVVYEMAGERVVHPMPAGGSGARRITGGTATLVSGLATQLATETIQLDHRAVAIRRQADHQLTVETANGARWIARHVVLALPPALVPTGIDFVPDLPEDVAQLAAITPVWMGAVAKVVAVFDAPFWRHDGLSGMAFSQQGPLQEIHDLSGPDGRPAALFGFAPRQAGHEAPIREAILAQMIRLFGAPAADAREVLIQDWLNEGDTSPPNADGLRRYDLYGHPRYRQPLWGGRLHFSSCETAAESGGHGHIEDALAAAARTVETIATTYGRCR